jgi:hypothetical protein
MKNMVDVANPTKNIWQSVIKSLTQKTEEQLSSVTDLRNEI